MIITTTFAHSVAFCIYLPHVLIYILCQTQKIIGIFVPKNNMNSLMCTIGFCNYTRFD